MAKAPLGVALRQLPVLGGPGGPTDQHLLEQFAAAGDQASFEALVQRHGRLVWGVCRRLLRHEQDAEDAYQATFLTLARKAGSLTNAAALAGWLYGVAYRAACRVRADRTRRQAQQTLAREASTAPLEEVTSRELSALLDEALAQLPDRYRLPIVLCYLEGLTRDEAARQLGWSLGTLKRRLEGGRNLLRGQLQRRGLAFPAALLTAWLAGDAASAPSAATARALARSAVAFARGATSGFEVVSARAVAVAEEGLKGVVMTKVTAGISLLVVLAMVVAGATALARQRPPDEPQAAREGKEGRPARVDANGTPLPAGALARLGTLRLRHGSLVTAVAYSPDGKMLASASWDSTVQLWDTASGRRLRSILPREGWVLTTAFSPDGKLLATGTGKDGKRIRLWNPATGALVRTLEGHEDGVVHVAFARDGKRLVSASSDSTARVWDVASGKEDRRLTTRGDGGFRWASFAPDGKSLVTADKGGARHWDLATGKELASFPVRREQLLGAALSPDGKLLATSHADGEVLLWDVAGAKEVHRLRVSTMNLHAVAFSPDGKTLAAGSGDFYAPSLYWCPGEVTLWDVTTGRLQRRLGEQSAVVRGLAFAPDGKAVAAADTHGGVLTWDPATGKPLGATDCHQGAIRSAAFAAGGEVLLTGGRDRTVRRWDSSGKYLGVLASGPVVGSTLAVSHDGLLAAWGGTDGKIRLCDAATGKEIRQWQGHRGAVATLAFAADGKVLASGGADRTIRLQNVATGELLHTFEGHEAWVCALAFSPDGRFLASGAGDGGLRVWDRVTRKELWRLEKHKHEVFCVTFSPDGRTLASASRDETVRLWESATGQLRRQIGKPGIGGGSAAFSPDGRLLFTYNTEGRDVLRLWDTATGRELASLPPPSGFVQRLAFSPDGKVAVVVGDDSTGLLWEVPSLVRAALPRPVPLSAEQLTTEWAALLAEDASRSYRASTALAATPQQTVPLLKKYLRKVEPPDAGRLARLIAELDADEFAVREQATEALTRLGNTAEGALRKALEGKVSVEQRRRIEGILGKLSKPIDTDEQLRQGRALELLERLGTDEAENVLKGLAKGAPEARLTQEARAALQRLMKHRPARP